MKRPDCIVIRTPDSEVLLNLDHVVRVSRSMAVGKLKDRLEIRMVRKGSIIIQGPQVETLWNLLRDHFGGGTTIDLDGSEIPAPMSFRGEDEQGD